MKQIYSDAGHSANIESKIIELSEVYEDGSFPAKCIKNYIGVLGVFNRYDNYIINDTLYEKLQDCFEIITKKYKVIKIK
jgi:hypothetical protein